MMQTQYTVNRTLMRDRRARLGLSFAALAQRSGLSIGSLARMENGKGRPQFAKLRQVAEALGVTFEELVQVNGGSHGKPRSRSKRR